MTNLTSEDLRRIETIEGYLRQLDMYNPAYSLPQFKPYQPIDTTEGEPIETQHKWQPSYGVKYWYIGSNDGQFFVADFHWGNDDVDFVNYDTGNCFKSREAAKKAAEAIKQYLSTNKF